MARHFIFDRALHKPHRVEVLQFYLRAKLLIAHATDGDVRLATKISLLHAGFRRAYPLQRTPDVIDVIVPFPRRTKTRSSYDFSNRHTSASQIDIRVAIYIRQTFVHVLARVLFEVQTGDSDRLRPPFKRMTSLIAFSGHDLEFAVG